MVSFFFIIAIASGFFGILILFAPKLYSSVAKRLSKTIATVDDAGSKLKIPVGLLLIAISVLTFYIIYLHKQMNLL